MLSLALAVGAVLAFVMFSFRSYELQPATDRRQYNRRLASSLVWFGDICQTVINTHSLRFVAANAPATVVTSFGAQQQRIARLSLRSANAVLLDRLVNRDVFLGSLSRSVVASFLKVRDLLLLAVCGAGRVTLGTLRALSAGIPRQVEIWISANLIAHIGGWVARTDENEGVSQKILEARQRSELSVRALQTDTVKEDILRALRSSLLNDVARLIFLSTLRDNNSGRYYHPEVARRYSDDIANEAMLACHREIYEWVVGLSLEDLTDQLDAYMATVPVSKQRLVESWTKLRAYRATIPMDADPISAEIYFTKIDVAVAILASRIPDKAH